MGKMVLFTRLHTSKLKNMPTNRLFHSREVCQYECCVLDATVDGGKVWFSVTCQFFLHLLQGWYLYSNFGCRLLHVCIPFSPAQGQCW